MLDAGAAPKDLGMNGLEVTTATLAAIPDAMVVEPAALVPIAQCEVNLLTAELEMAAVIQQSMLPKSLPILPGFQLAGFCRSARYVGGDFYDVLPLNGHSVLLAVADVMGKGVPAALFASTFRTLLRSSTPWTQSPAGILSRINDAMFDELSGVEMFITAQIAVVNALDRSLTVASAGHHPLLIADAGSEVQAISSIGLPLGISRQCPFSESKIVLSRTSYALMYTDGVSESRNAHGDFFGQGRLARWLSAASLGGGLPVDDLKEALALELHTYREGSPPGDDQTFLLLCPPASSTISTLRQEGALAA